MSELEFFQGLLWGWFGLSAFVFVLLCFVTAPYGRQRRKGWGPEVPSRLGWLIMELPAVVVPILGAVFASHEGWLPRFFLGMWLLHYIHRTFIYPWRMRMGNKRMPLFVALSGFSTNIAVNYLIMRWLFTLGPEYPASWALDPRFLAGVALFLVGFAANRHSDRVLRDLRKPGETGYKIPRGGLFRWISCPNYTSELLQWGGFALATWSLPALCFVVWSASNLSPRAIAHHRWYRERFDDYPPERKALIPYLL